MDEDREVTIRLKSGVRMTVAAGKLVFNDVPSGFVVGARKNAKPASFVIPLMDGDAERIVGELVPTAKGDWLQNLANSVFQGAFAPPPHSAIPVSSAELAGMRQAGEEAEDADSQAEKEREIVRALTRAGVPNV